MVWTHLDTQLVSYGDTPASVNSYRNFKTSFNLLLWGVRREAKLRYMQKSNMSVNSNLFTVMIVFVVFLSLHLTTLAFFQVLTTA